MASLITNLDPYWIVDGEEADAIVFNRALKQLTLLLDSGEAIDDAREISEADIETNAIHNDFVYLSGDLKYYRSNPTDPIIGVYKEVIDDEGITKRYVRYSGIISYPGVSETEVYYIDNANPGKITNVSYPGSKIVAIAISSEEILLFPDINSEIPSQVGESGKVLGTDGNTVQWEDKISELPDQTNNSGKTLITDGVTPTWTNSINDIISVDFIAIDDQRDFIVDYIPGNVQVFIEGIKLRTNEYEDATGTYIRLTNGAYGNDWVQIVHW